LSVKDYRRTSKGFLWWTWRTPVPPIPPNLLESVFYLYSSEEDAKAGRQFGGAGFVVSVTTEQDVEFLYAVTNQHVVGNGARAIRFNTRGGDIDILPTGRDDWKPHCDGDDIAVMPLGFRGQDHLELSAIPAATFSGEPDAYPLEIVPGTDVFVVSRFITHDGKQRNQPAVRFGHVAMMPGEPIKMKSGLKQVMYLAEMLSLSGASGSPVFAYSVQTYGGVMTNQPPLIGIDSCHLRVWRKVMKNKDGEVPYLDPESGKELFVEQNSGMMGVIPASKLTKFLNTKEFMEMRDKEEQEIREESEHVVLDVESGDSEFARFEDLARKVVRVPKPEVDEKRKDES